MQARRVLFSASLPLCIAVLGQQRSPSYGPNFLWGAATSAHQVEGILGGGQNSDWYLFEHTPGNILNGDNADVATNHWERYSEDFGYAAAMGLKTVRTSVSWEKIEPTEAGFNTAVIQHYRTELQKMRSMGLRPMITLLHATTPLWFAQNGAWL